MQILQTLSYTLNFVIHHMATAEFIYVAGMRFRSWRRMPFHRQKAYWVPYMDSSLPVNLSQRKSVNGKPMISLSQEEWSQSSQMAQRSFATRKYRALQEVLSTVVKVNQAPSCCKATMRL